MDVRWIAAAGAEPVSALQRQARTQRPCYSNWTRRSTMRFSNGLLFVMALALLSALVMPADALHGKIDNLFRPISSPVRQFAHGVDAHVNAPEKRPSEKDDTRSSGQLRDEIETLKFQLAQKDLQIADLNRQLNEFN